MAKVKKRRPRRQGVRSLALVAGEPALLRPRDVGLRAGGAVRWRVDESRSRRGPELSWTFPSPGIYRVRAEGGKGDARGVDVFAGVEEERLAALLTESDGVLVLLFPVRHHLIFLPLPASEEPADKDEGDGAPAAELDARGRSFEAYLEDQLCAHLCRLQGDPYVSPDKVAPGLYAVFPKAVFFLGDTHELRGQIRALTAGIERVMDGTLDASPQDVMAAVLGLVEGFSFATFMGRTRGGPGKRVLFPSRTTRTPVERWLRSVHRHWRNTHRFFERLGFDSRARRTAMFMHYNTHDGTFANRFANRRAAVSRAAITLLDTPRGGRGGRGRGGRGRGGRGGGSTQRRVTRQEMLSGDCGNEFKSQLRSMPGSPGDYHLTHVDPQRKLMRFSDGRGNHLTYKGGTWYKRIGDVMFIERPDGNTFTATKNNQGTWDVKNADGETVAEGTRPAEDITGEEPAPASGDDGSTGGDDDGGGEDPPEGGDDGDEKPDPRDAPDSGDRVFHEGGGLSASKIVALARGGGRIYPSPLGGGRPSAPASSEFIEDMAFLYGFDAPDVPLIDPGPTGRHGRGRRPPGNRPRPHTDTPGRYRRPTGEALSSRSHARRKTGSNKLVLDTELDALAERLDCCEEQGKAAPKVKGRRAALKGKGKREAGKKSAARRKR